MDDSPFQSLTRDQIERVIQMAWEDRTPFDAIRAQFGLTPGDVQDLMRRELKSTSFVMWRKRVAGRNTKHGRKRNFGLGRFRSSNQKG